MDLVRIPYRMKTALERGKTTVNLMVTSVEMDSDNFLGLFVAGAQDILVGEAMGRFMGKAKDKALSSGKEKLLDFIVRNEGTKVGKAIRLEKMGKYITATEKGLAEYTDKIRTVNNKYAITKDNFRKVFDSSYKPDVDTAKAAARAKQSVLTDEDIADKTDELIRKVRKKAGITEIESGNVHAETEHGVYVKEMPDGSLKVVGRDLSDPFVKRSFEGYQKVVDYHRTLNEYRQTYSPGAKAEVKAKLTQLEMDIREDFVAANHLRNYKGTYAQDAKAEYVKNWEMRDRLSAERAKQYSIEELSERGIKVKEDDLYMRSVTTNADDPYRTHIDTDQTQMRKMGAGSADIEVDPDIQYRSNVKGTVETLTGQKVTDFKTAEDIYKRYKYETVAGEYGKSPHAKEKFSDVDGMLNPDHASRKLKNAKQNAEVMKHKTNTFLEEAGKSTSMDEKINLYDESLYATGKDMNRTIVSRNSALMEKGHADVLTTNDRILREIYKRRYCSGAGKGHLEIDQRDAFLALQEIGYDQAVKMGDRMHDLTILVSGGE